MRITGLGRERLFAVPHRSAAHHAGSADTELPVAELFVDQLPAELDALFVTSDLQGRAVDGAGQTHLLGVAVVNAVGEHCAAEAIDPRRVGVLLAGDLYAREDITQRGGLGDVRDVWLAFARLASFVVGVAGNHDAFGSRPADLLAFAQQPGIHLLDAGTPGLAVSAECGGLRFAGVSGIVGNPNKPWRKTQPEFTAAMAAALDSQADVLLLHQNPALPQVRRASETWLTELLQRRGRGLVVFGHSFCTDPLVELGDCQLLATEQRAFWLTRAG